MGPTRIASHTQAQCLRVAKGGAWPRGVGRGQGRPRTAAAAESKEAWLMPKMRYRLLGGSGIKVSEICLGTMMFGGPTDGGEAQRIIAHAADNGVNFIDTANVYAQG